MYLSAITQREKLFDIAMRWLQGRIEDDDCRFVKLAFLVDPIITRPVVTTFLRDVSAPEGAITRVEHVRAKAEVRERIASACPCPSARANQLLGQFRACPERFYPTTPVDLFAITAGERDLLAMVRFKSIPRIADKVSRRATARFGQEIRRRAEALAVERPDLPADGGDGALAKAERQVCLELANGSLRFTRSDLLIGDLIGAKLIGDPAELERLEAKVVSHPQVVSVKRTEHHGDYTDTRLQIEMACPAPDETVRRLLVQQWDARRRGLDLGEMRRAIPGYVESGDKTFFLEIIFTSWEDLVESEFGRGLHEERTERQRDDLLWARQLSTNVTLTMMFMLLVAVAPTTDVGWLPIKLTGRYLPPDTMATILGRLFDLDIDRSPLWMPPLSDTGAALRGQAEVE
jgi:hypothetical protein